MMFGDMKFMDSPSSGSTVIFNGDVNFQHLLSRINVAPVLKQDTLMYPADDEDKKKIEFNYDLIRNEFIQIRKVEMSGFYTTANVSVTPASLSSNQTHTFFLKKIKIFIN